VYETKPQHDILLLTTTTILSLIYSCMSRGYSEKTVYLKEHRNRFVRLVFRPRFK